MRFTAEAIIIQKVSEGIKQTVVSWVFFLDREDYKRHKYIQKRRVEYVFSTSYYVSKGRFGHRITKRAPTFELESLRALTLNLRASKLPRSTLDYLSPKCVMLNISLHCLCCIKLF